jgi:peptidyl-prolyl cis-trans isomerase C
MFGSPALRILLLTVGLLACNKSADPAVSTRDSTLAQVNGTPITVDQFSQKWSQLPQGVRTAYSGPKGKDDFLGELITRELLLQKARKMKLDRDHALGERVEDFRERLLLEAVLHELVEKKIEVTEEEVAAYFKAHRDSLPLIEEARAAHILLKNEGEAKTLAARLRRGADFAMLARTHSLDAGSKDKGGDLGTVRRGRLIPELEQIVFELKPGRISDIVKSPYGYHIIRVQSRHSRKPLAVNEVRDEIRKEILKEKEAALFEGLVKTLKAESDIVISDSRLASMGENVTGSKDPAPAVRP